MPRRYYDYTGLLDKHPEFTQLHFLSSLGAYLTAIGFFLVLYNLLHSLFRGEKAPANPWGAATLEWQCKPASPT